MRLAGAGVVLGLRGAVAATRVRASVLPEVGAGPPLVSGAAAVLGLLALTPRALPACRVIGLDPASVLRAE